MENLVFFYFGFVWKFIKDKLHNIIKQRNYAFNWNNNCENVCKVQNEMASNLFTFC